MVWKPSPDKWCMLEVLCHLSDEEKDDFRTSVRSVLDDPTKKPRPIDPVRLVTSKRYIEQNFNAKLEEFIYERDKLINWLKSLSNLQRSNSFQHPTLDPMYAELILANWLAHDFIHIRHLNRLAYEFLQLSSTVDLSYAEIGKP